MSYRTLKVITILLPTLLIGGFEFLRHSKFFNHLSMAAGNYFISFLVLGVSYIYASWMFKTIKEKNNRITSERETWAIFEERERLAKELHDNIAQTLFLLKVHLKKGKTAEAQALVHSIDANVRQAIFNLRISPSEAISLSMRVENWLDDWCAVSGIDTSTTIDISEGYFTPSEEVQLFGIIQEAYTNIRKHSNAQQASLLLTGDASGWKLVIEDNGKGFSKKESKSTQYGLSMLKERAEKIKAFTEISSECEIGTKIIIRGSRW